MILSQEQGKKIMALIGEKWTKKGCCPMCNHLGLSIQERVLELREYNNGDIVVGGNQASFPIVAVMCPECGYTIFVNAIAAGVIK